MTDQYDDIINLPHWDPANHRRMPMGNRAAQFAPFAALTGHDEAIRETARATDQRPELDTESARMLDEKLALLIASLDLQPEIEVTYFNKDDRKPGGAYVMHRGTVRRIDEVEGRLVFTDGTIIPVLSITDMRGEIFAEIDNRE